MGYEIHEEEHKGKPIAVGKDEPEPAILSGKKTATTIEIRGSLHLISVAGGWHDVLLAYIAIVGGAIDAAAVVHDLIVPQIVGVKAAHYHIDIRIPDDAVAAGKEQKDAQRKADYNRLMDREFSGIAISLSVSLSLSLSLPLTASSRLPMRQQIQHKSRSSRNTQMPSTHDMST